MRALYFILAALYLFFALSAYQSGMGHEPGSETRRAYDQATMAWIGCAFFIFMLGVN